MKTINTRRVGDSFVPDMDPYSEYEHTELRSEPEAATVENAVAAPVDKDQAMKNFNEFLEGVDRMSDVFFEILKRF